MSSRMAGSVLLRHGGGWRLFSTATSPAARPLLAGGEGIQGSWVRLMSTSAASQAKDEAAKAAAAMTAKGDGEKKEAAVNGYWGIEQSQKLVLEDGTEWKWSCFRPWEKYTADTTIDLTTCPRPCSTRSPTGPSSRCAPTDIFFQAEHCRSYMANLLHYPRDGQRVRADRRASG